MRETKGGSAWKADVLLESLFYSSELRNKSSIASTLETALEIGAPAIVKEPLKARLKRKGCVVSKSRLYGAQLTADLAALLFSQRQRPELQHIQIKRFSFMDSSPQQKVDWLIIVDDQIKGTLLQQMYDVLQSLQSSTRQPKDSAAGRPTVEDDDPAIDLNVREHLRLAKFQKKRVEDTMFIDAAIQRGVLIPIGFG